MWVVHLPLLFLLLVQILLLTAQELMGQILVVKEQISQPAVEVLQLAVLRIDLSVSVAPVPPPLPEPGQRCVRGQKKAGPD